MSATVAAFDFDGTLTTRDTVVPFLRRFTSRRRFAVALLPRTLRLLPLVARRDRDRLRQLATEIVFRGRPLSEVEAHAVAWGAEIVSHHLRGDTVARLRWHLERGHDVVIVSASYEPYLHVVARELGDVDVLGTRLEVADGTCTGRLDGPNCRGPEKVRRLHRWLADRGMSRSDVTVHAYGDSAGDRELLAWADHPHWVNTSLGSLTPTP